MMEFINKKSAKEHLSSFLSIPKYIQSLTKELQIENVFGLDGNEMELIALIRNCPFLYEKSYPDVKVTEKKEQAWKAIAEIFSVSSSEVQHHWKHMSESFRKFTSKASLDPNLRPCVSYFDEMKFLLPSIKRRKSSKTSSSTIAHIREDSNTSASSELEIATTDYELNIELIEAVYTNPILYDRRHKDAENHEAKLKTWKNIAQHLGIPVSDCINKWKILRERYSWERNYRKANPRGRKWYLFDKLIFLENNVLCRRFPGAQIVNEKSMGICAENKTDSNTSNSHAINHHYCKMHAEDQGHNMEYADVDFQKDRCFSKCYNDDGIHITDCEDDSFRDEDDLFGMAILAEIKKISNIKKKMMLKADIYRLLYDYSD